MDELIRIRSIRREKDVVRIKVLSKNIRILGVELIGRSLWVVDELLR